MGFVAADDVDPHHSQRVAVEQEIRGVAELKPVQTHGQSKKLGSASLSHPHPWCPDRPAGNS